MSVLLSQALSPSEHRAAAIRHITQAKAYLSESRVNTAARAVNNPEFVAVANVHATLAAAHAALSNSEVSR